MDEPRMLILAKNDQHHPLETLGEMMVDWLEDSGIGQVTLSKERSTAIEQVNEYDLLIYSTTTNKLSPSEESAIVGFVESGKKLMAIHSATVVDPENVKFIEMIGGRFVHHSPHHEFAVKVVAPEHPIVAGVEDFKITDELYVLDRAPDAASVLLTAFWEDHTQPILYLRTHGKGEVLYNALGHGPDAYRNPNLKKLIIQGVKWLLR
jgi:type 1 glutamine amidotransferase